MVKLRTILAPALVLSAALATAAHAQSPLPITLEVRGGAGIPTGDFNDGISTGWNIGGSVRYDFTPIVAAYVGFDHFSFATDGEDNEGVDVGVDDNAFRGGVRANVPLVGMTGISPWVEGGIVVAKTGINASDGSTSLTINSDWGIGFEAGAGLSFAVAPRVSINPGVYYRQHKADFSDEDDTENPGSADVNYFALEIGISLRP
ncbi:outer membrane protein [Longimicrobium sp.]|uniref:outer membrane protein n=1 Tax=Longimicrobium sp. TaxID=2029185 RepID=UPI002B8AC038|nr:outer membrane beta-barrel protein [Longimicrobium sp.]HSU16486.1 outer membrane beta-barrel protein [Longimicrobium sp.]